MDIKLCYKTQSIIRPICFFDTYYFLNIGKMFSDSKNNL